MRLGALVLVAACASAGPPATEPAPTTAAATTLAYAQPTMSAATYSVTDSTLFEISGGPIGEIRVASSVRATTAVTYAQKGSDLEATMRVTDFAGTLTNSAMGGGGPVATESDIEGPATIIVTPRGMVNVASMPKLTQSAQQLGMSQSFFRRFFARLPARGVRPGTVWVDTISASDDNAGTKAVLNDIVTSTFVRDTVVNGQTLALITTTSQRSLDISGTSQGVQIAQKLTGSGSGRVLWDPGRHLLVQRTETAQLTGTFELPQMGVSGMPVTARGALRIALE